MIPLLHAAVAARLAQIHGEEQGLQLSHAA
jgi:hypothetical protein